MVTRRLLALVALLVTAWGLVVLPAAAQVPTDGESNSEQPTEQPQEESPPPGERHFVEVRDDGFFPLELEIRPNDVVAFVFVGENPHSATAAPDETNDREFDTHPECPQPLGGGCSEQGEVVEHQFTSAGVHRYSSRHPDDSETHAEAFIRVVAPPPPSPSPTPSSPSPTPTTTAEPTPTETATDDPEPSPEPTTTGTGEPTEDTTAEPTPSPAPQQGAAPSFQQNSTPVRPRGPAPQVAGSATPSPSARPSPSTTPTFDAFPDAVDPSDDEPDEVVIAAPTGPGPDARLVWGALGGGLVLATFGAFGRIVLFGEVWA